MNFRLAREYMNEGILWGCYGHSLPASESILSFVSSKAYLRVAMNTKGYLDKGSVAKYIFKNI